MLPNHKTPYARMMYAFLHLSGPIASTSSPSPSSTSSQPLLILHPSLPRRWSISRRRSMPRWYTRWRGPPPPTIMAPAPGCCDCTSGRLLPKKSPISNDLPVRSTYMGEAGQEGVTYLKSCMKWQMGQATSLYLCVASGTTGCRFPNRISVCISRPPRSSFFSFTRA